MTQETPLFLGISGTVVAIDPSTGAEIWRRKLKHSGICTVQFDGHDLFAGAAGEVFSLNPSTGEVLWKNALPGLGRRFVSFATEVNAAAAAHARANAASAAG